MDDPGPRGKTKALGVGAQRSELLDRHGVNHAFFTRTGGVSEGPFRSLNFSATVGDDAERVAENFARAKRALGLSARQPIALASQVHGADCVTAHGGETRRTFERTPADAVLSGAPRVAVAVRTADCVPILVADLRTGAVAAIHAGWRGVVAGVVGRAVSQLSRSPGDLVAAVGPHISEAAFEVSDDVAAQIAEASSPDVVLRESGGRPHVSLGRAVREQLMSLGLARARIDAVAGCTLMDSERFFSYRRDGPTSGRHVAVIVSR